MYAIIRPSFIAAICISKAQAKVAITKLMRQQIGSYRLVSLRSITRFPFYILECEFGEFLFHKNKPKVKRSRRKDGMPILYTIEKEFCWITNSTCTDKMGTLDHDHFGSK